MPVKVFYTDGRSEQFHLADAAQLRGPVFVVSRYDRKRRVLEEVRAFEAMEVLLAEVYDGPRLTGRIVGAGGAKGNRL